MTRIGNLLFNGIENTTDPAKALAEARNKRKELKLFIDIYQNVKIRSLIISACGIGIIPLCTFSFLILGNLATRLFGDTRLWMIAFMFLPLPVLSVLSFRCYSQTCGIGTAIRRVFRAAGKASRIFPLFPVSKFLWLAVFGLYLYFLLLVPFIILYSVKEDARFELKKVNRTIRELREAA